MRHGMISRQKSGGGVGGFLVDVGVFFLSCFFLSMPVFVFYTIMFYVYAVLSTWNTRDVARDASLQIRTSLARRCSTIATIPIPRSSFCTESESATAYAHACFEGRFYV